MSFQRKLLAVFALTVFLSVAIVTWVVSTVTRRSFEQADAERTAALVAQLHREFDRRGDDIARRIETVASSEAVTDVALALNRSSPQFDVYFNRAKSLADLQQLDFLELLDSQGTILSSAQWPARFGYKETFLPAPGHLPKQAFLKREELPEGTALGLFAVREVGVGDKSLFVLGGRVLDRNFLASLELPAGMRALFYQDAGKEFAPQQLMDPQNTLQNPEKLAPLLLQVQQQGQETSTLIHWSSDAHEDETMHAIPLDGPDNQLLGILLVGNSRRPYVELRQHIRSAALLASGAGIVLAILLSGWAAARVTRPVELLVGAAREVAAGNWQTQVPVTSADELGELAQSFNRMTQEMLEQRERLVQSERVAAWRELARRLAHELKNPLFPLQLTVENLIRARQQSLAQFDEIFQDSSATLLAEIANLKTIVSRFSEFSRMPPPQLQPVQLNELVENVARLFQAQFRAPDRSSIECKLELARDMALVSADPELLHRAVSNLVLNAMDAMPDGGMLAISTRQEGSYAVVEVSDTGKGLTPEECARLFTPYYTSKSHGTGLGLAIVQSVVSDHGGTIAVRSETGHGTTFRIELPYNRDRVPGPDASPSSRS